MPNEPRSAFLDSVRSRFGRLHGVGTSQSLFEIGEGGGRIYVRYSKVHGRNRTFFGLRVEDLRQLEGQRAHIAFLWDGQVEPLVLPYEDFEEVLNEASPASDGQIKVQIYLREEGAELYIARVGRFKVESYLGWHELEQTVLRESDPVPQLTHSQVQSLLGAIGAAKSFDIWVPPRDRLLLDAAICADFSCLTEFPRIGIGSDPIIQEIDVIWLERGSGKIKSVYEVEHSTTIYSGLLRLNDARLTYPEIDTFGIVADEARKTVFTRHVRRPTFKVSGLLDACSFLDYPDVYRWHRRLITVREARPEFA